ncbi:ABC transporter substrate-binding protein [Tsukamurella sp. 8F]|uniref:ABC transporter substrate-binding protein n=1 Tax=unclassified Tsukamurella TaxID=2633480 RepID=UPI0023B962DF|nr:MULTISPECIES: ABC transporter substrate-binding protein [unclassified Tsukamurella]MDF0531269.1 ABC transporter substrate-binding protein [Tsukamurella sp. 8J]MDF0585218.1 ABC transporter substrate-binding protein [Tsukamurella sp. 8F]
MTAIRRTALRCGALIASVAAVAALAGCGSHAPAPTRAATHRVVHEFGVSDIPDRPKAVVALDEYAAMDLLALGIVPRAVFTGYGSTIAQTVLRDAGSDVIDIPVGSTIDVDTVLGRRPDLVVFSSGGDRKAYDRLAPVVPTLPLTSVQTAWRKRIETIGAELRRESEAEHVVDVLVRRLTAVQSSGGKTIAVLMSYAGTLAGLSGDAPLNGLLADAGMTTPAAERRTGTGRQPYLPLSPEHLADHDADVVAVFAEGVYSADAVRNQPTFPLLTGHAVNVDGDMWFGTFPFAVYWILADLAAIERNDWSHVASAKDAPVRYRQFQEAIG